MFHSRQQSVLSKAHLAARVGGGQQRQAHGHRKLLVHENDHHVRVCKFGGKGSIDPVQSTGTGQATRAGIH